MKDTLDDHRIASPEVKPSDAEAGIAQAEKQDHPASARSTHYLDEERFHDEWGKAIDPDKVPVIESFEACTAPENQFIKHWLGDISGLRILDLGCGGGEAAVYFALQGAKAVAVDISTGMLEVTQRVARRYGVEIECIQQNAERLDFPDASFDVVYSANLLHHVNLESCLGEVCRVLRPEGRFVSWDPLRHNPIINIYRRIAAKVRTEGETPLDMAALKVFQRHFALVEYRTYWLVGLWIFMRFFLIDRIHPSKERYWKKIILDEKELHGTYHKLAVIDNFLMRCCPWLKRMCWNLVVCCTSPQLVKRNRADSAVLWNVELNAERSEPERIR